MLVSKTLSTLCVLRGHLCPSAYEVSRTEYKCSPLYTFAEFWAGRRILEMRQFPRALSGSPYEKDGCVFQRDEHNRLHSQVTSYQGDVWKVT